MNWWIWCVFGMVLLLAELITPGGFYLMFFGIAGMAVGGLAFFGLSGPAWMQWVLFSAISLASIGLFRRKMLERFASRPGVADMDSLVGESAKAAESIPMGGVGQVIMRGTSWQARNLGEGAIEPGAECEVEKVDGLVLKVRAR
jgi:inner membrane protein